MRILPTAAMLLVLASHHALAGVPNTVAIATDTSDVNPKIAADLQGGLAAEILYGLGEVFSNFARVRVNLTQVSDPKITARLQECEDAECLQDVAKSASVDLVVQVRVQIKKPSKKGKPDYAISMIVARDVPSRDAWREKTDCQACASSEIKHMASLLASTIAEQIKIDVEPPTVAPTPKPRATAVQPPPPPAVIVNPPPPVQKREWYVPRYLSVAGLVGGAALIGTGAYLVAVDGKGTCDLAAEQTQCPRIHSTAALGTGLLVGGGVAVVGGLVGLIFLGPNPGESHVALSFTGNSISVRGAF